MIIFQIHRFYMRWCCLCLRTYLSLFYLTSEGKLIWQTQLKSEFIVSTMISWLVQSANGNLWVKDNKLSQVYGFVVFRSIISLVCSLEHFLWLIDLQTVHFMQLFFEFIFWQIEQYNTNWVRLELFETRLGLFDSKKLKNWY